MPEEKDNDQFAERIKMVRKALGLNKSELARELGMSSTAIRKIEDSDTRPGYVFFESLSRKFNVNLYYLFHGQEPMFRNEKEEKLVSGILKDSILTESEMEWILIHLRGSDYVQHMIAAELKNILSEKGTLVNKELEEFKKRREQKG